MKRLAILILAAAWLAPLCLDASAQARKRVPRFEDFPVKEIFQGKSAPLALETPEQQNSVIYYQAIADGGANFAGHYAVVPLTCGKDCIAADYLDLRTGKVISGEFVNSGWKEHHDAFREMEFRRGSRLIVFAGQIDRKGPNGWHFYVFDDGNLKRIHTIVTRGDFRKPLTDLMK
jgi:hypothetical protein